DPVTGQAFGRLMQRILRKPVLRSQRRKGALPLLLLGARNGACCLPGGVSPHALQAPLPFGQEGVIQLARGFQMGTQPLCLPWRHLERQFQKKGRRWFARGRLLLCVGLPLPGHRTEPSIASHLNLCSIVPHTPPCCQVPGKHELVALSPAYSKKNG